MGKREEHPLPSTVTHPQSTADTCSCCCGIPRLFRFKCVFVLVLGLSVLLSVVFWLPPFFRHRDQGDLDLDSRYKGHDIVATFKIQKPLSLLQDDFPQLQGDIFDEIRVPTIKVILTAERNDRANTTKVIFGVDPDEYNSNITSYARSLVRESFVSLVLKQSPLHLTESLFGEASSFKVLKFVGGITVTPDQSAYPLQKVQIRFNFTLNYSIQQILDHFNELTSQLKSGLHLAPYENLRVSLTNPKGSTVAPQTTVQALVVLAFGTPSMSRSKQLAQTIKGSPTKNLGLNNTQFGRVKQISLSAYFNGSGGGSSGAPTPSPAPLPHPPPQPHHNHHHHHHHHHDKQLPPAKSPSPSKRTPALPPVPTAAPHNIHHAKPPDCHSGYNRRTKNPNKHPLFAPVSQPVPPPHTHPPPPPPRSPPPRSPPPRLPPPPPTPPPSLQPPPPVTETIPASGPLPNVVFAHTHPPSKSDSEADPPDVSPSGSFLQHSSACGGVVLALALRAIMTFVVVIILQQK